MPHRPPLFLAVAFVFPTLHTQRRDYGAKASERGEPDQPRLLRRQYQRLLPLLVLLAPVRIFYIYPVVCAFSTPSEDFQALVKACYRFLRDRLLFDFRLNDLSRTALVFCLKLLHSEGHRSFMMFDVQETITLCS